MAILREWLSSRLNPGKAFASVFKTPTSVGKRVWSTIPIGHRFTWHDRGPHCGRFPQDINGHYWASITRDLRYLNLTASINSRRSQRRHLSTRRYGPPDSTSIVMLRCWRLLYQDALPIPRLHHMLRGVGYSMWDVYRITGLPSLRKCMMSSFLWIRLLWSSSFLILFKICFKFEDTCILGSSDLILWWWWRLLCLTNLANLLPKVEVYFTLAKFQLLTKNFEC